MTAPRNGARAKLATGLILLAAFIVLPWFDSGRFTMSVASTVFITAIAATSLHLVVRTGHVSLAHAGFMGIGAYASAILTTSLGMPFIVGLLASFIAAAFVALLIGPLTLRLTGKYFSLVTFLFGEIVRIVFVEWTSLTGGSNGISEIPPPSAYFAQPVPFYYFSLAFASATVLFIGRLFGSEIGATIDAIRDGERLVESTGAPVTRIKLTLFALACGLAGVAGCLQAHFVRYIDPTSFSTVLSINLVMINVIGGMNSLVGPIVGTFFLVVFPEFLRGYVELQRVIFGVALIVVMAVLSGGVTELVPRLGALIRRATAVRRTNERAS